MRNRNRTCRLNVNRTCRLNVEILEDRCLLSTVAAFNLDNPAGGPFPSDKFTAADSSQLTGRRVHAVLRYE